MSTHNREDDNNLISAVMHSINGYEVCFSSVKNAQQYAQYIKNLCDTELRNKELPHNSRHAAALHIDNDTFRMIKNKLNFTSENSIEANKDVISRTGQLAQSTRQNRRSPQLGVRNLKEQLQDLSHPKDKQDTEAQDDKKWDAKL